VLNSNLARLNMNQTHGSGVGWNSSNLLPPQRNEFKHSTMNDTRGIGSGIHENTTGPAQSSREYGTRQSNENPTNGQNAQYEEGEFENNMQRKDI